jgi:hypothetical protein
MIAAKETERAAEDHCLEERRGATNGPTWHRTHAGEVDEFRDYYIKREPSAIISVMTERWEVGGG